MWDSLQFLCLLSAWGQTWHTESTDPSRHTELYACMQLMLSSDEESFGGFENLSKKHDTEFASTAGDYDGRPHNIQV